VNTRGRQFESDQARKFATRKNVGLYSPADRKEVSAGPRSQKLGDKKKDSDYMILGGPRRGQKKGM